MQHTLKNDLFNGKSRLWLGVILLLLLLGMSLSAAAQSDGAQLRLGHFVLDVPSVNLYADGSAVKTLDGSVALYASMTLPSEYVDFTAGAHTFAVAPDGETLNSAVVGDQEFTLEAGHRYLLALLGNVPADDLHFTLIDETAVIASKDITKSAVSILINNLAGIEGMDGSVGGKPLFSNLAYGDYFVMQDPTEGSGSLIVDHNNPDAVILDVPEATGSPAHFFAVFVFAGTFSGALYEGYVPLYTGQYEGDLTISDGGTISVGDSVPVSFTDMGQRTRFTLTLDTPAVLDVVQSGEEGADAFLRMYDAAGNLLRENDELSTDDNADNVWDAGWKGLSLDAGTYLVEAATFADTGTGLFTLSVSAAS